MSEERAAYVAIEHESFEEALAAGQKILARRYLIESQNEEKKRQTEEEIRQQNREVIDAALRKVLPAYFLDHFSYESGLDLANLKNFNFLPICLEHDGFAPIRVYLSREDPRRLNDLVLQGFRVAVVKIEKDTYQHLESGPYGAPVSVAYGFVQEENFFNEISSLPLALAISRENGERFTETALEIDRLMQAEREFLEERDKKRTEEVKVEIEGLDDILCEWLRQFILNAVRDQ